VQRVQETFLYDFHQCIQEDKRASQTWMLAANRTKVAFGILYDFHQCIQEDKLASQTWMLAANRTNLAFGIKLNALFRVPWAGWVSDA